jgi:serine/threonine protein phosphatase PrpC
MREHRAALSPDHFISCALTDAGSVRGNNEDEVYADDERGIYFVVDGMGGHAAGEEAARIAKARLRGRLERLTGTPEERVREAIALANKDIYEAAEKRPDWRGMACVLTVALLEGQEATIGHVGDSRLYKITARLLEKITRDHSPIGELEDRKEITEEEAMAHPRRNEVFRDVGSAPHDPDDPGFIDVYKVPVEPASALLLCSDGLTDALQGKEIEGIIRDSAGDRARVARRLIDRAVEEGKDNVSVVYVEGPEFAKPRARIRTKSKKAGPIAEVYERPPASVSPIDHSTYREQASWWKRAVIPFVAGMAVGAALFYGVQKYLQPAPPVDRAVVVAPATVRIRVDPAASVGVQTIAAAMNKANAGDTIDLAPGVYAEAVELKPGVAIEGHDAVIQPPNIPGGAAAIRVAKAGQASISHLLIRSGPQSQLFTGINVADGELTLIHVDISGTRSAGVEAGGASKLILEDSNVHDNFGAGVLIRDGATAVLKNNTIVRNGQDRALPKPGVQILSPNSVQMSGNTFAKNGSKAIWQPSAPSPEQLNLNTFEGRTGRKTDVRVTASPENKR